MYDRGVVISRKMEDRIMPYCRYAMSNTVRCIAIVIIGVCAGCEGGPEVVEVRVDLGADPIVFSWDGGLMHSFEVWECTSGCEAPSCAEGYHTFDSGTRAWAITVDKFADPLPDPGVTSPIVYGAPGGSPPEAPALVPGVTYSGEIARYTYCDDENDKTCRFQEARGCVIFTVN